MIDLHGYRVPCVTSCILQSEIGGHLARKHPFVAIMFEMDDRRIWSLRSDSKTGVNVAEIARAHGGGGHPNAASYIESIVARKDESPPEDRQSDANPGSGGGSDPRDRETQASGAKPAD